MQRGILEGRCVLILEDEFLIAMDVEELCRDHGAREVAIARTVAEAGSAAFPIDRFDVAIIDVTLDGQSTLDFAKRLWRENIPFIFASGYGEEDGVFERFPGVPVVAKPYAGADLLDAVRRVMDRGH